MLQADDLEFKKKQLDIERTKNEQNYEINMKKLEQENQRIEIERSRVEKEEKRDNHAHSSVRIHCIVLYATSGLE